MLTYRAAWQPFIALVIALSLCCLFPPVLPAQSSHPAAAFDKLVRDKRYWELQQQLPAAKLAPSDRTYFEGILADRTRKPADAIALLEKVLPELKKESPARTVIALRALASDYFEAGRYGDSANAYSELLSRYRGQFTPADAQAFSDDFHTYQLLRDAPPETVAGARNFDVPTRRDSIGDVDVPVRVGNTEQWWIFDTGANVSTISLSTANRLGLTLSKGSASTQSGATGAKVALRTAVIPELRFGTAILHNVVVEVLEDKSLDLDLGKNGHYAIQGILGYPVLAALGSFTFSGERLTVAPESTPSSRCAPMYVEELTPLIAARVDGKDLLFGFDTGANSGTLTAKYLHTFPAQFARLKTRPSGAGGAGGVRFFRTYKLPAVDVHLGAATARLHNLEVLTRPLGVAVLDSAYGNLGQSLVSPFRSYTIDFSRMQLCVGDDLK